MVSRAREAMGEKEVSVGACGKRIEGARESKNRGPRDLDRNTNHTERTCTQTTSISRGHSSTFDYIPFLPIEYTFILSNGVKSH